MRISHRTLLTCVLVWVVAAPAIAQEWPYYASDAASTKYSALEQIQRGNVGSLEIAWEWNTGERASQEYGIQPGKFEATPIMIDGVLYLSTAYGRVVALDPATGKEIWKYDPETHVIGQGFTGLGFVHRGVAAWSDGQERRIFMNARYKLLALDAKTGKLVKTFGNNGVVDLTQGFDRPVDTLHFETRSPPVIYENLVMVGSHIPDWLMFKGDPPGDVRAFDVHTGELVWSFSTVPRPGEPGSETWGDGSAKFTGHANVWAPMSLDEERGLLYLPVSTPSNDRYGGKRPGANLFAESIVCLDAATGERKWHRQLVHHGLWDYDMPAAPVLATIQVDGRSMDVAVQVTKMGWAFVFDRVSGEPVWPIEERPVPASDVPGEQAWPTQPFPSRPPAFARQGVSLGDALDFTPELNRAARAELEKYVLGPIYTPPSLPGTLQLPGSYGGANWGGAAFDPETGLLYVKSSDLLHIAKLQRPGPAGEVPSQSRLPVQYPTDADWVSSRTIPTFNDGLPLIKPPYGHVTAIDLHRGEIAWRVVLGDWPELRNHPALRGVDLPEKLGAPGPPGSIVTKGGLVFVGGGDHALHAFDKLTGAELWRGALSRPTAGTPMTYLAGDGRLYVVVATGLGEDATLVAYALPGGTR